MRLRHRNFALVASIALIGVVACSSEPSAPVADASVQEIDADYVMLGMDNKLTLAGVRSGEVLADSAWGRRDSAIVNMHGVTMTLFDDQGLERAQVTSREGVFNQRTEELMAYGDVVLEVNDQGVRIESSMLGYDPIQDEIWSDSVTHAVIDGTTTDGTCFRSDLQFQSWSVCTPRGEIPRRAPGSDSAGVTRPTPTPRGSGPPIAGIAPVRDTTGTPPDTTGAVAADSATAGADSTATPPDTTRANPPEADTVVPATAATPPDTTGVGPRTGAR